MVKKKEDTNVQNPLGLVGKYTLRSTGEEVEVIASNLVENGARSDGDWVTYIDSAGNEHIKEHLNIQLDFTVSPELPDMFKKFFEPIKTDFSKYPSVKNTRLFETVKQLVVERKFSVEKAVAKAKEIVEVVNGIYEDNESGQDN